VKIGDEAKATPPDGAVADSVPALPAWKAFAVQFSKGSGGGARVFSGRVEHLQSGRRTTFSSRDELVAMLERMLDAIEEPSV
jgi:hypothetical protein